MARFRVRSPLLRDIQSGYSYGQKAPVPTQPREKPDPSTKQIVGGDIVSHAITRDQLGIIKNHLRVGVGDFHVSVGTPSLAVQGTNSNYRAWSMANGVDSEIALTFHPPVDLVGYADCPNTYPVTGASCTIYFEVYYANLGAGTGNVKMTFTLGVTDIFASIDSTALYSNAQSLTSSAMGQHQNTLNQFLFPPKWYNPSPSTQPLYENTQRVWTVKIKRVGTDAADTLANAIGVYDLFLYYPMYGS